MKKILFLFSVLLLSFPAYSQTLDNGIQFYNEGEYERAVEVFESLNSPEATLYTGKAYFSMGRYLQSLNKLTQVGENTNGVYRESLYTRALVHFQLKNYAASLDLLHKLKSDSGISSSLRLQTENFYKRLTGFLNLAQRYEVFNQTAYEKVRADIVESAIGKVEFGAAAVLVENLKASEPQLSSTRNLLSRISALTSDSLSYMQRYNPGQYASAPEGITYNIGVALPSFDEGTREYEIAQSLYYGIQLAVERFNSESSGKKARISYVDTEADPAATPQTLNRLVWSKHSDVIIGPLFSEVAAEFAAYSEMYEVPLITPLANSDRINRNYNYTFQLNPTFAKRGIRMARHAFSELNFDTVSVLAEKGSLGEASALAFTDEFRRLGGTVVHYEVRDLESEGYNIRPYTSYLNPDNAEDITEQAAENVDAIYAPFTGSVASTLINALLTEIEASNNTLAILGSEEWAGIKSENRFTTNNRVFYSQGFKPDDANTEKNSFDSEYRVRFSTAPNSFSYIGFDTASLVLNTLQRVENPANFKEGFKNISNFRGLTMKVNFDGSQVNTAVSIVEEVASN